MGEVLSHGDEFPLLAIFCVLGDAIEYAIEPIVDSSQFYEESRSVLI